MNKAFLEAKGSEKQRTGRSVIGGETRTEMQSGSKSRKCCGMLPAKAGGPARICFPYLVFRTFDGEVVLVECAA